MLPTGTGKTVLFAALARYLSQHYVPMVNSDSSAAGEGVGERGAASAGAVAAAVAEVAAQEQLVAPAAPAAAEQHPALVSSETDEGAAAAGSTEAEGQSPSISEQSQQTAVGSMGFRTYRKNRNSQQQQQQATVLDAGNSDELQAASSSTTDAYAVAAAADLSSSNTGSTGSKDTAGLSSSDDSSSSSSKVERPRSAPAPECDASLMRVLVLAHRYELLHQVGPAVKQPLSGSTAPAAATCCSLTLAVHTSHASLPGSA
jgi:hypothetical protein